MATSNRSNQLAARIMRDRPFLTGEDLATEVRKTPAAVQKDHERGLIVGRKLGAKRVYTVEDVAAYLDRLSGREPYPPYTLAEAAKAVSKSRDTIYRWIRDGAISAVQSGGGAWLIPASEIDRICGALPPEPQRLAFTTSSHEEVWAVQRQRRNAALRKQGIDPAVEAAVSREPDLDLGTVDIFGNPISSDEWDDGEW